MSILVVTGTGTDVGKTITTAALAACASRSATGSVAVVKPAQTGVRPGEPGDLAEVTRLSGCEDVHEFARYPDPLSPHHAARISGLPYPDRASIAAAVAELAERVDLVLVEGAGGLLVPYHPDGWTILDLAGELDADLLLVVAAGLGTINHTALTVRAAVAAGRRPAGIVVGSWPRNPGLAELCNLDDLAQLSGTGALDGVLPAGMSTMADFTEQARAALSPRFGGSFDWVRFRESTPIPRPHAGPHAGPHAEPHARPREGAARR